MSTANVVLLAALTGQSFIAANGAINYGGNVYTYLAGTLTASNTYTDYTGSTLNPNPIPVNVDGYLSNEIWIPDGTALRVRIVDGANNLLQDIDQIPGVNDLSTSGFISHTFTGYLTSNTTGVVTFGIPQTSAEIQGNVVPVNFLYQPGNVLRYGNNSNPGTTNMNVAFQAAFNQQAYGGAPVYAPTGQYLVAGKISTPQAAPFRMFGDGMGKTVIIANTDIDLFVVNNSAAAYNKITISDITIYPSIVMSNGSGFNLTCTSILPSVTMRDVEISSGGSSVFANAIRLNNCGECELTRVFIYGPGANAGTGIAITSNVAAAAYKFIGCSIYNVAYGVSITNTVDPGIEGIQFYGCDIVNVFIGVIYTNNYGSAYFPPQLTWIGGHINANFRSFDLSTMTQVFISGLLSYNSNSAAQHISLNSVGDVNINGCQFQQISGNSNVIDIGSSGTMTGGLIHGNIFRMGTSGSGVYLNANNVTQLGIKNNQRTGGAATVTTIGTLNSTVIIQNNTPQDTIDIFDTTLTGAATMSLLGIRSNFCVIGSPSSNTLCTSLAARNAWDQVILECSSANLTIQHNGTNPNGFILSGGVNYTFPATGGRITLQIRNGGYWTEVCRDG